MELARRWLSVVVCASLLMPAGCTDDQEGADSEPEGAAAFDGDLGTTPDEPCPDAVNPDNGCVYLGVISDLEGPSASRAVPLTEAQHAFWDRVNEQGGVGGYDVDTRTYTRDSGADLDRHAEAFADIRDDVLALAQTFGSPQTAVILSDLDRDDILAAPTSWTSAWVFEDVVLQSGTSSCMEAMNAVDLALSDQDAAATVVVVHYEGDYGDDAAAGAHAAATAHGADITDVVVAAGGEGLQAAIDIVVSEQPAVLYVATGPLELATIVAQAAARGFGGRVLGAGPTWHPQLLDTPAAAVLEDRYWQAAPWGPWGADSDGHRALRDAVGDDEPSDAAVSGWVWQYPLKAAIEAAVRRGDLSRSGLRTAATELRRVDYEGMLPAIAGRFADHPANPVRASVVNEVDPDEPTGVAPLRDFFVGTTAAAFDLTEPCFQGG